MFVYVIIRCCLYILVPSLTDAIITVNAPNATNELHSITVTCIVHPDSTADQCVVMAMADDRVTRTGNVIIQNILHIHISISGFLGGVSIGKSGVWR